MYRKQTTFLSIAAALTVLVAIAASPEIAGAQVDSAARSKAKAVELAKFDDPQPNMAKTGPGGTEWDAQYRCFIQTDSAAISKGLPTHAAAASKIKEDAALSPAKLQMHKGWILYIKHFSQAYRPETATADFKRLYVELINMEFPAK